MKPKSPALRTLAELGPVLKKRQRDLAKQAAERAAQARAAALEQRAAQARAQEFQQAVGRVEPLRIGPVHLLDLPKPAPLPLQRLADEQAALRQTWSDEVDLESLLLTDDGLSYRRPDIGIDVVTRLRKGHWAIQGQVDLHGLRRDEAREALGDFLRDQLKKGRRCVRVVHGKGLGSPGRQPVLKAKVQKWLAQAEPVIAFAQAAPAQGGAGALVVLLQG